MTDVTDALFVLFAASVLLTSAIAAARALQRSARRRRVLAVRPAASLEALPDGEEIVLRGRVRSSAALCAPLTGRPVAWARVTVRAELQRPGLLTFHEVHRASVGETLTLEPTLPADAAAARPGATDVTVALAGATIVPSSDGIRGAHAPKDGPVSPELLALLRAHADLVPLVRGDGHAEVAVRAREEAIAAGDEVSVLGRVRRSRSGEGAVRIEPGPAGLYVAHGDVQALARTGGLFRTAWATVTTLALASLATGCSRDDKLKSEAAVLQRAVERYRQADNLLRPAAADALAETPCSVPEICAAKDACVAAAGPTAQALRLKQEVERGIEAIQSGTLTPTDPQAQTFPGKLDEASTLLDRGHAALTACDEKMLDLKRRHGL